MTEEVNELLLGKDFIAGLLHYIALVCVSN